MWSKLYKNFWKPYSYLTLWCGGAYSIFPRFFFFLLVMISVLTTNMNSMCYLFSVFFCFGYGYLKTGKLHLVLFRNVGIKPAKVIWYCKINQNSVIPIEKTLAVPCLEDSHAVLDPSRLTSCTLLMTESAWGRRGEHTYLSSYSSVSNRDTVYNRSTMINLHFWF